MAGPGEKFLIYEFLVSKVDCNYNSLLSPGPQEWKLINCTTGTHGNYRGNWKKLTYFLTINSISVRDPTLLLDLLYSWLNSYLCFDVWLILICVAAKLVGSILLCSMIFGA